MASVSPDVVGLQFIQAYYTRLNQAPEKLYQFYNKSSTRKRSLDGEAVLTVSAQGQAGISAAIKSEGYKDAKVRVSSVDSIPSCENGVLVQVVGDISNAGGAPLKFVQTFFLCKQPNGYFVLNDILRILKTEYDDKAEVETGNVENSLDAISTMPAGMPVNGIYTTDHPSGSSHSAEEGEHAATRTTSGLSWAEMASQEPAAPSTHSNAPSTRAVRAQLASRTAPAVREKSKQNSQKKGQYTVYIGKVNDKINQQNLEAALKVFGTPTRVILENSRGRAFADFSDSVALKHALDAGHVTVNGVPLTIEERTKRQTQQRKRT